MKTIRILLLALFTVIALAYINIVLTQPQHTSAEEATPTDTPAVTESPTPSEPTPTGVTPTESISPTADVTPTSTPSATPTPPTAGCSFTTSLPYGFSDTNSHDLKLYYIANSFSSNHIHASVCISVDNQNETYATDVSHDVADYNGTDSIPVSVSASHVYKATMYTKNVSDTSQTCSGTVIATCSLPTYLITPTVTPTDTPDNSDNPSDNSDSGTCTSDCGDHNTTVVVNQEQQQQVVLAASVAPAPTTTQLPSTGADDFAVIGTLFSLLPIGWKIRKLI